MSNPQTINDFQIATFASGTGGLVTLDSLGVSMPNPIWQPAVSRAKLGNNSGRLLGLPTAQWQWGFLSQAARDALRAYCPGATAQVYIISPTTEKIAGVPNASARFLAQMWWESPDTPEAPATGRRLQFSILFKQLASV